MRTAPISSLCNLTRTGNSSVWGRDGGSEERGEMISISSITSEVISSILDINALGCQSSVRFLLTTTRSSAVTCTVCAVMGPRRIPSSPSSDTCPLLRCDTVDPSHRRPEVVAVNQAPKPATITTRTETSNATRGHHRMDDFPGGLLVTEGSISVSFGLRLVRTLPQWKSACAVCHRGDLGQDQVRAGLLGCASERPRHSPQPDPAAASYRLHHRHR